MKKILIIVLLLSTYNSYSQTYFNNTYGQPENYLSETMNGIAVTNDGYYLSFFSAYDDNDGDVKDFGGIIYMNIEGIIQDTFAIQDSSYYTLGQNVITTLDGGFLINMNSDFLYDGISNVNFHLAKVDKDLNEVWNIIYNTSYYDISYDVLELADSSFLILGASDSDLDGGSEYKLQKIDKDGNTLWIKYYGHYTRYSVPYGGIKQTSDGGFLIVGLQKENYHAIPRAYMVKIDSEGEEEWSRWNGSIDSRSSLNGFIELSNENYLVYGTNVEDNSSTNSSELDGYIAEINPTNGTVIKEKHFGEEKFQSIKEIIMLPDSSLVVRASYKNENDRIIGWLFKLDKNWNILWERYFQINPLYNNYIYDMEQTLDGGFLLVGSGINAAGTSSDMWVIKTDSLGCDVAGCAFVANDEVEPITEETINIYPNPFSIELRIVVGKNDTSWNITDITGKTIQTGRGTQTLKTSTWQSGMYILYTQDGESKKLVKL